MYVRVDFGISQVVDGTWGEFSSKFDLMCTDGLDSICRGSTECKGLIGLPGPGLVVHLPCVAFVPFSSDVTRPYLSSILPVPNSIRSAGRSTKMAEEDTRCTPYSPWCMTLMQVPASWMENSFASTKHEKSARPHRQELPPYCIASYCTCQPGSFLQSCKQVFLIFGLLAGMHALIPKNFFPVPGFPAGPRDRTGELARKPGTTNVARVLKSNHGLTTDDLEGECLVLLQGRE